MTVSDAGCGAMPPLSVASEVVVADIANDFFRVELAVVDMAALIDPGQEAVAPQLRSHCGSARTQDDVSRKVLIFRTQPIRQPRSHAGPRGLSFPGIHHQERRLVAEPAPEPSSHRRWWRVEGGRGHQARRVVGCRLRQQGVREPLRSLRDRRRPTRLRTHRQGRCRTVRPVDDQHRLCQGHAARHQRHMAQLRLLHPRRQWQHHPGHARRRDHVPWPLPHRGARRQQVAVRGVDAAGQVRGQSGLRRRRLAAVRLDRAEQEQLEVAR